MSNVIIFGGLIGYVRNRKMIPYDNDLDLMVDGKFWNNSEFNSTIAALSENHEHECIYRDNGLKLTVYYSKKNKVGIDIWPFYI